MGGVNHRKKMARLRYAELMLKMRNEGKSVEYILGEINKRLKKTKFFEDIELKHSSLSKFLSEYEKRAKQ